MRTRCDQLAERVLVSDLSSLGEFETEREAVGTQQRADLWFSPTQQDPENAGATGRWDGWPSTRG